MKGTRQTWYKGNVVRLVRPKFILQFPTAALLVAMMGFGKPVEPLE